MSQSDPKRAGPPREWKLYANGIWEGDAFEHDRVISVMAVEKREYDTLLAELEATKRDLQIVGDNYRGTAQDLNIALSDARQDRDALAQSLREAVEAMRGMLESKALQEAPFYAYSEAVGNVRDFIDKVRAAHPQLWSGS